MAYSPDIQKKIELVKSIARAQGLSEGAVDKVAAQKFGPQPTGLQSQKARPQGLIRNVTRGLGGSAQLVGGGIFEGGRKIASDIARTVGREDVANRLYVDPKTGKDVQNPFLRQDELESLSGRDIGSASTIIKKSAGTASLIPAFKGIGSVAKIAGAGAGAAGLQEFSEDDATAESIAKAAAVGGVTSGILAKLSKVLKGRKGVKTIAPKEGGGGPNILKKAGRETKRTVRGFERYTKGSPWFSSTVDDMHRVADEVGLKGSALNQLDSAEKAFNRISDEVSSKLTKSSGSIQKEELTARLVDRLQKARGLGFDMFNPAQRAELDKIVQLVDDFTGDTGKISAADLFKIKQQLGIDYKRAFARADPLSNVQPTIQEEIGIKVYQDLRNIIDEVADDKTISQLTRKQSTLFDITNALGKGVDRPTLSLGAVQPQAPGFARVTQSAADKTGRTLEGAGNILETGAKSVRASQITLPSGITLPIAAGQVVGRGSTTPTKQNIPTLPKSPADLIGRSPTATTPKQPQGVDIDGQFITKEAVRKATILAIADGNTKAAERLKSISEQMDALFPDEEETTAVGIEALPTGGERNAARDAVTRLREARAGLTMSEGTPTGPISSSLARASELIGSPTGTTVLRNQLESIRNAIRQSETGVQFSPEEQKAYLRRLPTTSSQEGTIRQALEEIERKEVRRLKSFGFTEDEIEQLLVAQ